MSSPSINGAAIDIDQQNYTYNGLQPNTHYARARGPVRASALHDAMNAFRIQVLHYPADPTILTAIPRVITDSSSGVRTPTPMMYIKPWLAS